MKCPSCGSTHTKKIHVLRTDWASGLHECLDCYHKAPWTDFCIPAEPTTGVRSRFEDLELPTRAIGNK